MKIGTVAFWKAFTGMQDTTSMTTPADGDCSRKTVPFDAPTGKL